jgi:hypothetical protein
MVTYSPSPLLLGVKGIPNTLFGVPLEEKPHASEKSSRSRRFSAETILKSLFVPMALLAVLFYWDYSKGIIPKDGLKILAVVNMFHG